jgi:hypothetical protein
VFRVSLHGLDKIGDQVITSRKLYIDLGKRIAHTIPLIDQTIVDTDYPEYERGNYAEENQE